MSPRHGRIAAVIVTRNRPQLLQRCLHRVLGQTRPPDLLVVVDNASDEETPALFARGALADDPRVAYLRLDENTGGAGGFHAGMARALDLGADWIWCMDDDAWPDDTALSELLRSGQRTDAIYGTAALADQGDGDLLIWPVAVVEDGHRVRTRVRRTDLPDAPVAVENVPFLGLLIHRALIGRIGLPDKGLFLSGDDAEYCARARSMGADVFLVPRSVLRHPPVARACLHLARRRLCVLRLAPWRRYYDTRNRLIIARRYFGLRLWTEALPGTLLRWLVTLLLQPERLRQSGAFLRGIRDGLGGRDGPRWPPP